MFTRTMLVGLGAGVALTAALYYPLAVQFPSQIIEGSSASPSPSGPLVVLAIVLISAAAGLLAAWGSSQSAIHRAGAGALAGFIAAFVAYSALVNPAVGAFGARDILAHGPGPTVDEYDVIRFLGNAVVDTIWLVYLVMGAMFFAGSLLGGLGGAIAPSGEDKLPNPDDWRIGQNVVLSNGLIFAALNVLIAMSIYGLLVESLTRVFDEIDQAARFPLEGIPALPLAVALIWYLVAQVACLAAMRAIRRDADRLTTGLLPAALDTVMIMAIPVMTSIFILTAFPETLALGDLRSALFLGALAITLVFVVFALLTARDLISRWRAAQTGPARFPFGAIAFSLLPVILVMSFAYMVSQLFSYNVTGPTVTLVVMVGILITVVVLRRFKPDWFRVADPSEVASFSNAIRRNFIGLALGGGLALAVPTLTGTAAPLNIVLYLVTAIPNLTVYEGMPNQPQSVPGVFSDRGSAGLMADAFQIQFNITAGALVIGFVISALCVLLMIVGTRWMSKSPVAPAPQPSGGK